MIAVVTLLTWMIGVDMAAILKTMLQFDNLNDFAEFANSLIEFKQLVFTSDDFEKSICSMLGISQKKGVYHVFFLKQQINICFSRKCFVMNSGIYILSTENVEIPLFNTTTQQHCLLCVERG